MKILKWEVEDFFNRLIYYQIKDLPLNKHILYDNMGIIIKFFICPPMDDILIKSTSRNFK